jgi:hypothetical protein
MMVVEGRTKVLCTVTHDSGPILPQHLKRTHCYVAFSASRINSSDVEVYPIFVSNCLMNANRIQPPATKRNY